MIGHAFCDNKGNAIFDKYTQIALGSYPEISAFNIQAKSENTGDELKTVSPINGIYVNPDPITAANSLAIASTHRDDTIYYAGAHCILIEGVDNNYHSVSEEVWLEGHKPCVLKQEFACINKMTAINWGNKLTYNYGDIMLGTGEFTEGVPETAYCMISKHDNISMTGVYTVPASHTLLTYSPEISGICDCIKFKSQKDKQGIITDYEISGNILAQTNYNYCRKYKEKTQLQIQASGMSQLSINQPAVLIENSCWK